MEYGMAQAYGVESIGYLFPLLYAPVSSVLYSVPSLSLHISPGTLPCAYKYGVHAIKLHACTCIFNTAGFSTRTTVPGNASNF